MKLKIGYLYPDLLEVYSDRGNVTVLQKRSEWRGIECQVDRITIGDQRDLSDYDLLFSGGGEDREQLLVAEDLLRKRESLFQAVASGTVVFTICGSYQLLGHYFETIGGKKIEGVGLLDLYTIGGSKRLVGNSVCETELVGKVHTLVGYENHSGRTYLGDSTPALASVVAGQGNNGGDGKEGAAKGSVFGTYLHGPILSKNPFFADHLLQLALARRTDKPVLPLLDDTWEMAAHTHIVQQYSGVSRR
ncbi:glutamine amidotransferase [Effusibacillus dendaii]|uniref:Lipid II isoglutaminyl synthase (glutamine-hydrolyzing) subunit GatD n=1 Tax=Effusibacillus dendaii TaxID=2743772 RepID=A0A7I8DCE5_9BACL|nr:glutamine amidotransferase [Effusibacillus dendaii]